MLKKTINYTDYNGKEQEKTFLFNLTKTEITKMELSTKGGLVEKLRTIVDDQDGAEIVKVVEDFISLSYGEKSADGSFVKSQELSKRFSETVAYDTLFMELVMNPDKFSEFINGIVPQVTRVIPTSG
jgi:hypothetical protein